MPNTETKLKWEDAFDTIDAYAMQEILKEAGRLIDEQLAASGDELLSPGRIPWYVQSNGLYIRADMTGWSWRMLKNTITGLEFCLLRKGIFHEVYVNAVLDPTALDAKGERHMSLLKFPGPPENSIATTSPTLHRCINPHTQTRLLYVIGRTIGAYNMQELLDDAQRYAETKVHDGGDRRVLPGEIPLPLRSHGLLMIASLGGWSWQVLNHTIATMRLCLFKQGLFREVDVKVILDPVALPGPRQLVLRREERVR